MPPIPTTANPPRTDPSHTNAPSPAKAARRPLRANHRRLGLACLVIGVGGWRALVGRG